MSASFAPGQWVRLTAAPEWGLGQVQSVEGVRVTVNFEHAGKRLIQTDIAKLETIDPVPEKTR